MTRERISAVQKAADYVDAAIKEWQFAVCDNYKKDCNKCFYSKQKQCVRQRLGQAEELIGEAQNDVDEKKL